MAIEVRTVSGYDQLERWTATRNVPGPEVFTTELAALVRATELDRVDLLALEDGDPVGMGFLSADPVSRETGRAFVQVKVPEEHRGRGVGSALLAAVSNHARRLGVSALRCSAREDDAYSVAFLERRGFEVWTRASSGEWRGRGVGSSLLRTQAEAARALGLRELVAIALVKPIQRLYERCGYQSREHWLGFEGPLLAG